MFNSHRIVRFLGELVVFALAMVVTYHTHDPRYNLNLALDAFHTYGRTPMNDVNKSVRKNRTVIWDITMDELALKLAMEQGYYPEKANGGVSKFLSDLVEHAATGKRNLPRDLKSDLVKKLSHVKSSKTDQVAALQKQAGKPAPKTNNK